MNLPITVSEKETLKRRRVSGQGSGLMTLDPGVSSYADGNVPEGTENCNPRAGRKDVPLGKDREQGEREPGDPSGKMPGFPRYSSHPTPHC